MQSTKISSVIQRSLMQLMTKFPLVQHIAQTIADHGGRTLLVGGAVRDLLLADQVKDMDLEIHGLESDRLERILKQFGAVDYVGKSFGVFKLFNADGQDLDIALPRTDSSGRKPDVHVDPFMSVHEAFRRRDVTINAMGIDLITYELIDPFDGYHDLHTKTLRAVDTQFFIQDPLRFYRVMQFIGRFQMNPDDSLNAVCKTMDVRSVSVERIEKEFEKLFLKSAYPSRGIRWLRDLGRIHGLFPELGATIGIEQGQEWHPEGDVFEHSMQTLDAAATFVYEDDTQKLTVMYAALCHDIGKATTTKFVDGRIISYGHAKESAVLARTLLKRITGKKDIIKAVVKLVACHMQPLQLVELGSKPPAYKRLARRLAPEATIAMIALLARADRLGRNPIKGIPLATAQPLVDLFIEKAHGLQVLHQPEAPVLLGRDIMDVVEPGPRMGQLLRQAYQIQIEEGITDKDILKSRVINYN